MEFRYLFWEYFGIGNVSYGGILYFGYDVEEDVLVLCEYCFLC